MKSSYRPFFSLLAVLVFIASLCVGTSAESAVDTILRTGTTQAFTSDAVPDEDIRTSLQAVAVLLIGAPAESADAVSGASVREDPDAKSVIIH